MRSNTDHYVYSRKVGDHFINVVLYVDGIFLIGNNKDVIKEMKYHLSSKFDMKDISAANFILGMEIRRDRTNMKIWLNQIKYVDTIL